MTWTWSERCEKESDDLSVAGDDAMKPSSETSSRQRSAILSNTISLWNKRK